MSQPLASGTDRIGLLAHAISQPLTLLGLAIASLELHRSALRGEVGRAYARDLEKLRKVLARLNELVAEMRPKDGVPKLEP